MACGDHQDDDDDLWSYDNRIAQLDGQKMAMRASQERLTILTEGFTDEQKGAAAEMGMQALMDVRCKNLVNPLCDWLGEIYDTASREFVIPGRGRLPLDEESVFCTLGVPHGEIKVPYEVNNKIEETLFARLFPGTTSMPNTTVQANSLESMKTHGEVLKMKLLMYLISAVFAPTTSLRPSNKCLPILVNDLSLLLYSFNLLTLMSSAKLKDVKNMNYCKFITNFLHDAFLNKMYQKGCRLHLMNREPKRKTCRRPASFSQSEGVKIVSDMPIFFLYVHYVCSGVFPTPGRLHYVIIFFPCFLFFTEPNAAMISASSRL
ncbi:hypothetical protein VPH35_096695 [Triticum aestivum]